MNQEVITELNKILPVVERVHGDHHPELHEVAKLYKALLEGEDVFEELRKVTSDYTAPSDACPTYIKTYNDLKKLDEEH
ncbi:MAG: iron-sulfur cluster repair di-iron protein, ric [Erysipelotrichaceae bacterium]|nr:iron-sulfur cluster repair di-iron protein, ric [Erysipelotrichaceae bacterium]